MFRNQKGQINLLGIIGIGVSIAIATIGGFMANNYRNDIKINNVNTEINATKERTARLEEAIQTLKVDNAEIKRDVKTILLKLK